MVRFCAISITIAVLTFRAALCAESEADAFKAASEAFRDKFYERAEDQFASFSTNFPSSTNLARAVLLQGQARHFQKKHDAAVELLNNNLPKAGSLADEYLLTIGDALSAKGNHAAAAVEYGKLFKDFPNSPLRLQAGYLQGLSLFQQKDFQGAIALLGNPDGEFKKLSDAAPQDRFSFSARLLLGDALLAMGRAAEAGTVGAALPVVADKQDWTWEKFDLLARVEFASTNAPAALAHLTNAVAAAKAAQRPRLEAQSRNLEAELYRRIGQPEGAVTAYEKITGLEALPVDERRLALLKSVELLSTSGNLTNAILRLETYLGSATNEPAADFLKVKAGELWIEQAKAIGQSARRERTPITNALAQARDYLNEVVTKYTNSAHVGRAWLNLGWASWEEAMLLGQLARLQESEAAFRIASEKLTRSDDQAIAIFKTADVQMQLRQPRGAMTNYSRVLKEFADLPQVKNALFDKTYVQLIRANIELEDLAEAERALKELRAAFPNNPATEEAIYVFGQALMVSGNVKKARSLFQEFLTQYPSSPFVPDVRFAEARTHGLDGNFALAVQEHDQWLQSYANHSLRPDVEFERCVLLDKAGQGTNALTAFTNFVAHFPTHTTLAPAAQTWVADYYHTQEQWGRAEQNYQRVFQNTNWSGGSLAYYSRMMAARTAFRRASYNDARSYLTNLINDPRCPAGLKPEAWFALGDIFLEEPITGSTNALYNFTQAAAVFDRIVTQYPTNEIAVLATAKKGDCYFQIASHTNYLDSYITASNAYTSVPVSYTHLTLPTTERV